MQRKHMIILVVMLSIFVICITIISVYKINTRESKETVVSEIDATYASNSTLDTNETSETIEEPRVSETIVFSGITYTHLEYLAEEQVNSLNKLDTLLTNSSTIDHGADNIVSAEVESRSIDTNLKITYLFVTYESGDVDYYVGLYDDYSQHDYLRCIREEEYIKINNGANAG